MQLYLLRHGEAEPREPHVADAGRALTRRGKKDVRAVLKAARVAMDPPQLILTSPLLRARETAAVAEAMFPACPVQVTNHLKPSSPPEAIRKVLDRHPTLESILLVGHEPHLSRLLAMPLDFKKGTLIRTEPRPPGSGHAGPFQLKWMLTPKLARAL